MTKPPSVGARRRAPPRGRMNRQLEPTGGGGVRQDGNVAVLQCWHGATWPHGRLAGASRAWYISSGDDAYPPGRLSMVRAWSELGHPLRSELVALAPPYRAHTSVSSLES